MILDDRLEFCDAVACAGTGLSTILGDIVDTGDFTKNLGSGEPMYLVVSLPIAISSGGTSIEFQLRSSTETALTGGTTVTHATTGAVDTSSGVAAGTTFVIPLPGGTTAWRRYIGIWRVTVGAVPTTNTPVVNAFLTKDASQWRAYADATN